MPKLIKESDIVDDDWHFVPADNGDRPDGKVILPMAAWLALADGDRTSGATAPWIDSGEEFGDHIGELAQAPLIAIHFPTFMDGRGFSTAEILRRHGYRGELRAVGELIQDQLFFLKRCGFDCYQLREGTSLENAVHSLKDFSISYQTSADTETPLFRHR